MLRGMPRKLNQNGERILEEVESVYFLDVSRKYNEYITSCITYMDSLPFPIPIIKCYCIYIYGQTMLLVTMLITNMSVYTCMNIT